MGKGTTRHSLRYRSRMRQPAYEDPCRNSIIFSGRGPKGEGEPLARGERVLGPPCDRRKKKPSRRDRKKGRMAFSKAGGKDTASLRIWGRVFLKGSGLLLGDDRRVASTSVEMLGKPRFADTRENCDVRESPTYHSAWREKNDATPSREKPLLACQRTGKRRGGAKSHYQETSRAKKKKKRKKGKTFFLCLSLGGAR